MNRTDFMNQLESLLQNISPAEREEALQYYNEYFNDAGPENEQDVIEALGNPAKVAENIKRDLYGSGYGDTTYQRAASNDRAVVQYQKGAQSGADRQTVKTEDKMPTWLIVLIVVLCVFASPVLLSAAAGVLSTLLGIVAAWFGMILGFGCAAVGLLVAMLALIVVGIMCMFSNVLAGVAVLGIGLLLGGLGILFLMLTVAMAGIATPAICKGCVSLYRKLTTKKQVA